MHPETTTAVLCLVAAALAVAATLWGLSGSLAGPAPLAVTTIRGEDALLFGQGIYRFDSLLIGAGFVAQDIVTLFIAVPVLVAGVVLRGHATGLVLRVIALAYLLYAYASMALGAAYNPAFLLYIAIFSVSLFTATLAHRRLKDRIGAAGGMPRRSLAAFLFLAGSATAVIWLMPLVEALLSGAAPDRLDAYTTPVTDVLDLGIIVPLCFIAGMLVLGRSPMGATLAVPLLGLIVMLLPAISLATWMQIRAGIVFTPPEIVGPIAGFLVLGAVGALLLWKMIAVLRTAV